MYDLTGKVALVTGAATGIGRAIATRLAAEGADVAILDVDEAEAARTAARVREAGRRAQVVRADVGDGAQVEAAVAEVVRSFGGIDVAVHNAGILRIGPLLETSLEDFRQVFRVNVDGVFLCCRAVAPHLVRRGGGAIVNTASWLGKKGMPHYGAYCASKAAIISLTQTLAAELGPRHVRVNAVCPGIIVDTGMRDQIDRESARRGLASTKEREAMVPLGRVGRPDDVARAVAFLASSEADYMTGQALNVTGGFWMH